MAGREKQFFAIVLLGLLATLASGCGSTIHKESNIGGIDTLSIDAKQRLMLVGRSSGDERQRVTCTEPSPDALVARAAALAVKPREGKVEELSGSSSESAASIGFRNQTVQMLRDGYFRLCEAYLNGAIDKKQYQHMIMNVDTFIVVVSALQTLGTNPIAPAVAIATDNVLASKQDGDTKEPKTGNIIGSVTVNEHPDKNAANAAQNIVRDYLKYRERDRYGR